MKVKIESERRFTITVDAGTATSAVHKGCRRVSEWNGLTEFKAPDGAQIIVKCDNDLSHVLSRVIGDEVTSTGDVVLISPSLAPTANKPGERPETR